MSWERVVVYVVYTVRLVIEDMDPGSIRIIDAFLHVHNLELDPGSYHPWR